MERTKRESKVGRLSIARMREGIDVDLWCNQRFRLGVLVCAGGVGSFWDMHIFTYIDSN